MGKLSKLLVALGFQSILFVGLFGKQDSTITHIYGIETGYLSFGSIDEIVTPFLYSGSAPMVGFNKMRTTNKSIRNSSIFFSQIKRVPATLNLKSSFTILSSDEGIYNTWHTEPDYREVKTVIVSLSGGYYRQIPIHIISNDRLLLGVKNNLYAILRTSITNPEIISFTINPGMFYMMNIGKKSTLSFETNLNLFGLSIRRPYAGAEAQVTNKYDFVFFKDYVIEHLQTDFINDYFQIASQVKLEKAITGRFLINIGYRFHYLNLQNPRRLESLSNSFIIGFSIKTK